MNGPGVIGENSQFQLFKAIFSGLPDSQCQHPAAQPGPPIGPLNKEAQLGPVPVFHMGTHRCHFQIAHGLIPTKSA